YPRALHSFPTRRSSDLRSPDNTHGTAIASVIGANANNAKGMVGIAPDSRMELYVACWAEQGVFGAVCDSFTLAKALDTLLNDPRSEEHTSELQSRENLV